MGKCVSCNFGHIFLMYYIMADVKPCDLMENIMFKYCGRCFNHNIWQIGLYIVAYKKSQNEDTNNS